MGGYGDKQSESTAKAAEMMGDVLREVTGMAVDAAEIHLLEMTVQAKVAILSILSRRADNLTELVDAFERVCKIVSVEEKIESEALEPEPELHIHEVHHFDRAKLKEEFDALREGIHTSTCEMTQNRLYAAQQALAWVLWPEGATSPADMILKNGDAAFSACAHLAECNRNGVDPSPVTNVEEIIKKAHGHAAEAATSTELAA